MEYGLLDEVASLIERPGGLGRTARQAVGYRQLLAHLEEGAPLDECVRDAITQSRRLARRQRSWFHRDPRVEWFQNSDDAASRLIEVLSDADRFVRD
jgi:tRNA dimethylallyltransferase